MINYIITIFFVVCMCLILMKLYDLVNNKQYTKKDYFQKSVIFGICSTITIITYNFVSKYMVLNSSDIKKSPILQSGGNLNISPNTDFSPVNKLRFNSSTPTF